MDGFEKKHESTLKFSNRCNSIYIILVYMSIYSLSPWQNEWIHVNFRPLKLFA